MTTFYVLHGDDDISLDEAVNKLRAEMGSGTEAEMNMTDFNGEEASVPEIIGAVSSYPFLADKRMAIVRGLLSWITRKGAGQTGKDAVARLKDDLPNLPPYARLIFVERATLPDKHPILALAGSHAEGFARVFATPKDTTGWIIKRAKSEYGAEIENRAAMALSEVTGDDLRRADNELIKLVSYVEPGQPITEADVAALTPYIPEADIFKMVDAIAEGRGQQALDLLHRLQRDKKQDAFSLFGMIARQFRLLIQAREHLDAGGNAGDMASAIKVKPFVAKKLAGQSRNFALDDLERIYRNLQDADRRMKTGRIDPPLALDLFIAGVTTPPSR